MADKLIELLKNTKVEQVAPGSKQIHVIKKDDKIIDGLKLLFREGLVSAPVYDQDGTTFLGLVDAIDILAYIVSIFDEIEQQGASIFNRLENEQRFAQVTVSQVADFAHSAAPQLALGSSLWDALPIFVQKKAHRCPIVNEQGQIVSILTQAAVINLVAAHPGCLGEFGKWTVKDLDIGSRPVLVVEKHIRAIDAFKKMHEHHISGIGVMDPNGYLIGNISARDLKELDPQNIYQSMYESSAHFVQRVRERNTTESYPAISCSLTTAFEFLIGRLAVNRIHRMYVCDQSLHPIRVISLRDVLEKLYGFLTAPDAPAAAQSDAERDE